MCRNIKTLHNFKPPATDEEIRAFSRRSHDGHQGGRARFGIIERQSTRPASRNVGAALHAAKSRDGPASEQRRPVLDHRVGSAAGPEHRNAVQGSAALRRASSDVKLGAMGGGDVTPDQSATAS